MNDQRDVEGLVQALGVGGGEGFGGFLDDGDEQLQAMGVSPWTRYVAKAGLA